MVTDAAYYQTLIEQIMGVLESLDVTGYAWAPSDGWTQARYSEGNPRGVGHLETWITLGPCRNVQAAHLEHELVVSVTCRYQADDDSVSQARTHAAARSAVDALAGWRWGAHRLIPRSYVIEATAPDWLVVSISCTLLLPRGD